MSQQHRPGSYSQSAPMSPAFPPRTYPAMQAGHSDRGPINVRTSNYETYNRDAQSFGRRPQDHRTWVLNSAPVSASSPMAPPLPHAASATYSSIHQPFAHARRNSSASNYYHVSSPGSHAISPRDMPPPYSTHSPTMAGYPGQHSDGSRVYAPHTQKPAAPSRTNTHMSISSLVAAESVDVRDQSARSSAKNSPTSARPPSGMSSRSLHEDGRISAGQRRSLDTHSQPQSAKYMPAQPRPEHASTLPGPGAALAYSPASATETQNTYSNYASHPHSDPSGHWQHANASHSDPRRHATVSQVHETDADLPGAHEAHMTTTVNATPMLEPGSNQHNDRYRSVTEGGRLSARASPMPHDKDPSIKNEFGRMFSGLGSGVGGSTTPTAGTPTRRSPAPPGRNPGAEMDLAKMHAEDAGSVDGRDTPTGSGGKRQKTMHHHHHHHHRPHHHHHSHHHHTMPDSQTMQQANGFGTLRFPATSSSTNKMIGQNAGLVAVGQSTTHHHHHRHGTQAKAAHHHHSPTWDDPSSNQSSRTIINNELMQSVYARPRYHLGSIAYNSTVSPKASKHGLPSFFGLFEATPTSIPRLEGKENCTFTVRVPRAYVALSDDLDSQTLCGGLGEICRRRAVWGTGVYTDDSDVVAAAVHAGWIQGDFGHNQADLDAFDTKPERDSKHAPMILDNKPAQPVKIPPATDMHVTVVLLPALTRYASTTMHHLRSRAWSSDHDGISFAIHAIKFVEEPRIARLSQRGSAARRHRLDLRYRKRQEAAESLSLMSQSRDARVSVSVR